MANVDQTMVTSFVLVAEFFACLGYGAAILRLLGIHRELSPGLYVTFAFATGLGVLGWVLFPLGVMHLFQETWLWGSLIVGIAATPLLRESLANWRPASLDSWGWTLASLIAAVLFLDFVEALMPPTDADSLAYHFNAPKRFLETGGIFHILRPLDGAIPYLIQMSYVPALGLGGEQALTLWTMLSGWMAGALLYALSREYLSVNWSLVVTLLFLSAPAVIYSAGTGQIEIRMTLFALAAAWATARSLKSNNMAFTVLAGMMVGFYIGAKYIGLLYALACGLVIIFRRNWFRHGLVFGLSAIVIGFQWYAWNAVHTGDPFFPVFFSLFGKDDLVLWDATQQAFFQRIFMPIDRPIDRNILTYFQYPFLVTVDAPPATEGRKVGLGPAGLFLLPFALLGVWQFRDRVKHHPLLPYAAIAFLFYSAWFISGPSQRVRHLTPLYPLLLICFIYSATRFARSVHLRRPLYIAIVASLALQLAGAGLFGVKYIRALAQGESRDGYLASNLSSFAAVPWVNTQLTKDHHLIHSERQLNYYFDISNFFVSANTQGAIDMSPGIKRPELLAKELRSINATHFLTSAAQWHAWTEGKNWQRCFILLKQFNITRIGSRTLSAGATYKDNFVLLQFSESNCD